MQTRSQSDKRAISRHNADTSGNFDASHLIDQFAHDRYDAMTVADKSEQMHLMRDGEFAARLCEAALRHDPMSVIRVAGEFEAALLEQCRKKVVA